MTPPIPSLLLVSGEVGDAPTPIARAASDLVARLDEVGVAPALLVSWNTPPSVGPGLPSSASTWSPLELDEVPVLAAARRLVGGAPAGRLRDLAFRAWLRRRRNVPVYATGLAAAEALPWFGRHGAPVAWHLNEGEVPDEATLAELGHGRDAFVDVALVVEADAIERVRRSGIARAIEGIGPLRPDPMPPPPAGVDPVLGLVGDADLARGVDRLPRLLWEVRARTGTAVTARWFAPSPQAWPGQVQHDLRRLGLATSARLSVEPGDLRAVLGEVHAVVLPWRHDEPEAAIGGPPLASSGAELITRAALAAGRPVAGFRVAGGATGGDGAPGPVLVDYPEVEVLADAVAAAVGDGWERRRRVLVAAHGADALLAALRRHGLVAR
jgi:hypothetical protein